MEIKAKDTYNLFDKLIYMFNTYSYDISARGLKTKELEPTHLIIEDPVNNNIITHGPFKHNREYLFAEFSWYAAGRKDTEFIAKYAPFWNSISIDGEANSAYGRWIFNEGVNQWARVINILKEDPSSRKAVIYLGDRNNYNDKDTICTNTLQFRIKGNKLEMYVNMRSNDVYWGLRNDLFMFTMMQQYMAKALNVEVGAYHHYTPSLHIYEKDFHRLSQGFNYSSDTINIDTLEDNLLLDTNLFLTGV